MKKSAVTAVAALFALLPLVASAHEHGTYQIGKHYYQIVIGSLNEPVAVDDKTGVDLTVSKCFNASCIAKMSPDGDMDGPAGTPVIGLDQSLKVELQAGGQSKQMALKPQYGKPGAYTAGFYPTVATSFSYHFTGTIDGTPVDLTYSCLPEGGKAADVKTPTKLSDGVTQMTLAGGFGCPLVKESLGFPEMSVSVAALSVAAGSAKTFAVIGIVLSILALIVAGYGAMKRSL